MLEYFQEILLFILEILCCKIFYETFGEKRYKNWINIIQIALLSCCSFLVVYILTDNFAARQVIIIIVFSVFLFWNIKISFKKSVILAILFEGLLVTVDYVAFSINSKLFSNDILEGALVILFGKAILFLCVLLIRKQFGKKATEMLGDSEWLRFLFFPIFTIAMISAMLSVYGCVETSKQADLLFVIAFGMAIMNIIVFNLLNDIVEREIQIHENSIFQMQVKNQTEMYRSISENFNNQKQKTHEYKNQIICIESLLHKKQYVELEKYVKGIYGSLNKELNAIDTNNVIVNAILNTKYQEAVEKGIVFVFRVNDLSDIRISDEDIVIILSNLLNNAIEACESCTEKKIVKLKFTKEDYALIIAVKNTFNQQIRYENGEIKSIKLSETEEHGVGIKNVIRIIEKYEGSYIIQHQNKEFYFSVHIPHKN